MRNASEQGFAAKLFAEAETPPDAAKGPMQERGFAAQATNLRIWNKDGRLAAGLSWASYVTDEWEDEGTAEKLTLVFASRYVLLYGHHLLGLVRQIDEGRLRSVVEVDGLRAQELAAENAGIRDESKKTSIVVRVEVGPQIDELVSDLKGEEDDETRYPRRVK